MSERDLHDLLLERMTDEPQTFPSAGGAIRRARTLDRRRRAVVLGGVAGVAALVTTVTLTIGGDPDTTSVVDDSQVATDDESPTAVSEAPEPTQDPGQPLSVLMESAATAALAPHFSELGAPEWSFTDILGNKVPPDTNVVQVADLDYPKVAPGRDTVVVRLTVYGFAPEEWEIYDYPSACDIQLEARIATTCETEELADGSLRMTTVAARQPTKRGSNMLTPEDAAALPISDFVWMRGVSVLRRDGTTVAALEQVRARTAAAADWQVPLDALTALAGDPTLVGAAVAHEAAPSELPE
jgi:hypothetical protein